MRIGKCSFCKKEVKKGDVLYIPVFAVNGVTPLRVHTDCLKRSLPRPNKHGEYA